MNSKVGILSIAALGMLSASVALAGGDGEKLPSGADVLARSVEASGGADKIRSVKSRVAKGEFRMAAAGIEAKFEMYQANPGSMYTMVDIPGMGIEEQGTDGKLCWAVSSIQGPRVMEGDEAVGFLRQADMSAELNPEKYYSEITCVGVEDVEGDACHKVELVLKEGGEHEFRFYSVGTGLMVAAEVVQATPMGNMKVRTISSDYRDVDGIKVPFMTRVFVNGMEQVLAFDSVEQDVEIDPSKFEMPEAVKALID